MSDPMRNAIHILLLLALCSCGVFDTSTMYDAKIIYADDLGPGMAGFIHTGVSTSVIWVRPDLPELLEVRAIVYGMTLAMALPYSGNPDCAESGSETFTDLCASGVPSGWLFKVDGPQQLMDDCVTAVSWWAQPPRNVTVRVE